MSDAIRYGKLPLGTAFLGALLLISGQLQLRSIVLAVFESVSSVAAVTNRSDHDWDPPLPLVACVIYTYHGNRELIKESYETGGHLCQDFDAFSDEEWYYAPTKATIPLRTYPAPDTQLIADVRKMWQYLADRYENRTLQADFGTFSGDDAFWILPALRMYLSNFTVGKPWLLLGGVDARARNSSLPWIGGAGYVISRSLIEERVLQRCPERFGRDEDMFTSSCLYWNGVNFTDTRDGMGKRRFCRAKPGEPCGFHENEPSDEVVLFHYTKGAVRKQLAEQYYGNSSEPGVYSS